MNLTESVGNEWKKFAAIELDIRHKKNTLKAGAATTTAEKNHFDSVFKSHVMGPRCMMPSCLCKLLLFWPKLYTHHIHHDIHVHVCLCNISYYCICIPTTFRWNALPIFSPKKDRVRTKKSNSGQFPKRRWALYTQKTFMLVGNKLAFHNIWSRGREREKKLLRFIVRA